MLVFLLIYKSRIVSKPLLILVASYAFYAFWDWRFLSLLALLSVVNFVAGKYVYSSSGRAARRALFLTIAFNIGLLGIFKYFNFFLLELANLLEVIGFEANLTTLRIMAPLGISFYIFQITSYVIDIYRKHLIPTNSLIVFSAFASYFPHMAAGPIMPAKDLLPQIATKYRKLESYEIASGIALIVNGLVRKVVIADTLAPMVNRVFGSPQSFDWKVLVLATIGFALQIYCDFSGYSNMARGISRLLGIELIINFKQPYFSRNIQDFWRRWHISLSSWFRDYLYIPLGGSKGTAFRTTLNLLLVMTIAGLWHGAGIGFLIWGFFHGLALALFHLLQRYKNPNLTSKVPVFSMIISIILTNIYVIVLWIPFRLPETTDSIDYVNMILARQVGIFELPDLILIFQMLVFTILLDLIEQTWTLNAYPIRTKLLGHPILFGCVMGLALALIATYSSSQVTPFIYFQF